MLLRPMAAIWSLLQEHRCLEECLHKEGIHRHLHHHHHLLWVVAVAISRSLTGVNHHRHPHLITMLLPHSTLHES